MAAMTRACGDLSVGKLELYASRSNYLQDFSAKKKKKQTKEVKDS